jgi:hypothetical protein
VSKTAWVNRWGYELAAKPERPGVYRLRDGGFLLRARVAHPQTGKLQSLSRVVRDVTLAQAVRERDAMIEATRRKIEPENKRPLFSVFAVDLFEQKKALGKIKSGAGRLKWKGILDNHLIKAFGLYRMDEVSLDILLTWQKEVAERVNAGKVKARTVNSWIDAEGSPHLIGLFFEQTRCVV